MFSRHFADGLAALSSYLEIMVTADEIVTTLAPLNGGFFHIDSLTEYAAKVTSVGRALALRDESDKSLRSYVLFYDNGPEVFVTMVWTRADQQGRGWASKLLRELIYSSKKDVVLQVHVHNPARQTYEQLGFIEDRIDGNTLTLILHKRVAVMQPYVYPYIGYFHLIQSASEIVFYDDVNYIKQGWINRNRILSGNRDFMFTIPVADASQNRLIKDVVPLLDSGRWREKFIRQLHQSYGRAPHFAQAIDCVMEPLKNSHASIADLAIDSIRAVYDYLDLKLNYLRSSECCADTKNLPRADRLISITKNLGYSRYVNSPGGVDLYDRQYFLSAGVELSFLSSKSIYYEQGRKEFVPNLSIIDVLMFNDKKTIRSMLSEFNVE